MLAAAALAVALVVPAGSMPADPPAIKIAKSHPNQTGVQDSAYRGDYYRADQEPYRKCVGQREGRHQYWGTGGNGYYLGTYQMSKPLTRGSVWMITKELRRTYGDKQGRAIRDRLFEVKPTKWNRFYWDMAFYTVLNWEHRASGAKHWAGGRFSCHPTMTSWGGAR